MKKRKSKKKWAVIVGQKPRQRILPKLFTSYKQAAKEANLWSDADVKIKEIT
jgi:hypothetical protein